MVRARLSRPEQDIPAVELGSHFLMTQEVVLSSAIPFERPKVDRPFLLAPLTGLSCVGSFELCASDCGFWWPCIIMMLQAS
jgi:hypothetical protein